MKSEDRLAVARNDVRIVPSRGATNRIASGGRTGVTGGFISGYASNAFTANAYGVFRFGKGLIILSCH